MCVCVSEQVCVCVFLSKCVCVFLSKCVCVFLSKCVCVSEQVCVCVEHLKRCKTSYGSNLVDFRFFAVTSYLQGTQHFTGTVSNEATSEMGYPAWPAGRTCAIFQFRQWRPAKPSTGMSFGFTISIMDYAASEPSSELRCQQVSTQCTVFAI